MKVTIFGSGNIGGTLGKKWAAAGHAVTYAARDVADAKYKPLLDAMHGRGAVAPLAEAARSADAVLFAIPGAAVAQAVAGLGDVLDGKIIVDATNKMREAETNNLAILSAAAPNARLFRAFNSLGWENFETPQLGDTQIDLFYCGDSGETREVVDGLIADVGLRPVYIGGLDQAAVVDTLTRLWFAVAIGQGYGRRTAFKLITE